MDIAVNCETVHAAKEKQHPSAMNIEYTYNIYCTGPVFWLDCFISEGVIRSDSRLKGLVSVNYDSEWIILKMLNLELHMLMIMFAV
jgi:hypothetical protein